MNNEEVIIVKLAQSFADVFCKVDSDVAESLKNGTGDFSTVTLKSPMIAQIVPDQSGGYGVQLHVLCQFMAEEPKDQQVTMYRDAILFVTEPVEELARQYRSNLTGIQEATASDLAGLER